MQDILWITIASAFVLLMQAGFTCLETGMVRSKNSIMVRTQSNHIFISLYATARLEILSSQQGLNKFALKLKLYINAIRQAFNELQNLKSTTA